MRQAILENLKSLVGLLALLLVCGLFAWTLNGARSARAEAYGASQARHRAELRLNALTRAWLRQVASEGAPSLRGAVSVALPERLSEIAAGAAGQPSFLADVRSVLESASTLSEPSWNAEEMWRQSCRPVLAAELERLLPGMAITP